MKNRKLEIVQKLLELLPESSRGSTDDAMVTWWTNIRRDGGLRLTNQGYHIMHDVLKLESWHLDLSEGDEQPNYRARITKRIVLELDKKLEWPYYLDFDARKKRRRIIFFNSREAMMATMYGDLERWLKSI